MSFDTLFEAAVSLFMRSIGSAIVTVFVSIGLVFGGVIDLGTPADLPHELVRQRLDDEQRVAQELGFVLADRVALRELETRHTIRLAEDECVALVAGTSGVHRIMSVTLTRRPSRAEGYDPDAVAADPNARSLVAHAQYCATEGGSFSVRVRAYPRRWGDVEPFGQGELRILRAPRSRVARLNRGWTLRS